MRKYFFVLLLCTGVVVFSITPAEAHLIGAFKDFLIGMDNKDSTKELQETINNTKEQQKELTKNVNQKKEEFKKEQDKMVSKMMFYNSVAFDSYASFIFDNKEMVDAMANQKIMNQIVSNDLQSLDEFYNQYTSLQDALNSVKGYEDLLNEIQKNKEKQNELLNEFPNLTKATKQQFASILQAIWNTEMKKTDEYLVDDSKAISEHLSEWSNGNSGDNIRMLSYKTINRHTHLHYFIQKDHVYITYETKNGHVILVSQLVPYQKEKGNYTLEIEAGFLDGYAISSSIVQELNGKFVIHTQNLHTKDTPNWLVQQDSNALILQPTNVMTN